jgi:hypothetical protein
LRKKVDEDYDYHACVHRFDQMKDFYVYPIVLEERLPELDIPLLPGDGSVTVDLQAVFDRSYDAGPYRREIDYAKDAPDPPLDEDRTPWAKQLIAGWKK